MPISVVWDNPQQTIIRATFDGKWDAGQLCAMIVKGRSMIDSVNHPVDNIFDLTRSASSPTSALATLEHLDQLHSEKERLIILVKANGYIKTLCNIARKLSPKTFASLVFVDGITEAYQRINKQSSITNIDAGLR